MKVGDVMAQDVEYISRSASLKEAAELMGELDVGALPVGTAEAVSGIVTDRDILYRYVAAGLTPAAVTVGDVMTSPVIHCDADDPVRLVLDTMAANHIRRMPVRRGDGPVVGWITLADLARTLLVDSAGLQDFLQGVTGDQPP